MEKMMTALRLGGGSDVEDNSDDSTEGDKPEVAVEVSSKAFTEVLNNLYNNFNVFFDRLELGDNLAKGCDYILLLRALCSNTTVRHVTIERKLMENFNADEIRIMLEVIGGMPKLESLRVHFPSELPLQAKSIANVFNRTKYLKEVQFYDLKLAGDEQDMDALGEALEALTNLKIISLHQLGLEENEEDDLEPVAPDQIANYISSLPVLEEFVITTRQKFEWFEDSLGDLCASKTLKILKLQNMELSTSHISSIAESLQTNTSLLHLQLSDCGIDADGWRALASSLPENKTLRHLDLSQCSTLDDDGCFILGSCMEGNTALKTLQLYNDESSEVSSKGISSLSRMLENNHTLECLEVSFHATDANGYKAVAEALARNTTLNKIFLENHATGVSTRGIVSIAKVLESDKHSLQQVAIIFDGADNDGVLALAHAMDKSSKMKHFTFNRAEYRSITS